MDLPITQLQYDLWKNGMLIQEVMPEIGIEEREFLITGMTKEEQASFFNREEDE